MGLVRVAVPVYMPEWLHSTLRQIKRTFRPVEKLDIDLIGDRDVEWSFIASRLPCGPGHALDFGCGGTYLSLIAARRGFQVAALDLESDVAHWQHPNRRFVQGDLLVAELADASFDLVINCSSVEHVGLVGRYGVLKPLGDGDLEAMRKLRSLMKPGATQLLTIPVGRDSVFPPWHRVYGRSRLPMLLDGYVVEHEEFWCKSLNQGWALCDREEALEFVPEWDEKRRIYSLGCFILR
jgi:SAM-dependent methyltransferase